MLFDSSVEFSPLVFDFNGDGGENVFDLDDLADEVISLVERAVEPFDIKVEKASSSSKQDILDTFSSNGNSIGNIDTYVLLTVATSDFYNSGAGGSIGMMEGLFGIAATEDLFNQFFGGTADNEHEEVALVFADRIIDQTRGEIGTEQFNANLVQRLVNTAVHETFHTFSVVHTLNTSPLTNGDVIRLFSTDDARENPQMVTRFNLPHSQNVAEPNTYELIANDPDIGLRDSDGDDIPDLAYVTGTAAHDRITFSLDATDPNILQANIEAFENDDFTNLLAQDMWSINLTTETEGTLLVDAGLGNDLVQIDANVPVDLRVRGMLGDDKVELIGVTGTASQLRSVKVEGEKGDDNFTLNFDDGDALPLAGFNLEFQGGQGNNTGTVIRADGSQHKAFFVNVSTSAADTDLTDGIADSVVDDSATLSTLGQQISLRSAIEQAQDASSSAIYVFLPSELDDDEDSVFDAFQDGEFNITGELNVIGSGAGASVVDVSAAPSSYHFQVSQSGDLEVRRMTLTGGNNAMGGSIHVEANTNPASVALTLSEAAVVNNGSMIVGGAIYVGAQSKAQINKSVISNDAASWGGGGIFADGSATGGAEVTLFGSIVVNNFSVGGSPNIDSGGSGSNRGKFTSDGYNLLGDVGSADFTPDLTDVVKLTGGVDYVVTSVVDTFDHSDNEYRLSLREAVDLANQAEGQDEIWLPAWNFVLTRDRANYGGGSSTDTDVSFGDLDITESLAIRGVDGVTSVAWRPGVVDEIFDLLGDYNGDGINTPDDGEVTVDDYYIWEEQDGSSGGVFSADGDDDGDVDGDDYYIWSIYLSNYLDVFDVAV